MNSFISNTLNSLSVDDADNTKKRFGSAEEFERKHEEELEGSYQSRYLGDEVEIETEKKRSGVASIWAGREASH